VDGQEFCHDARMKKVLLYVPIILSLLVLGAHFVRYGNSIGIAAVLVLILMLFIRQWWVARLVQVALLLGALEWSYTIWELVQLRASHDIPYVRMVVILGTVATVTLGSALLFQTRTLKKTYRLQGDK
jgi:hypothetical protein